jgi:chaperonin GroEL (HSP60 family)
MSLLDTQLIEGLIIDKEVVHSDMPKRVDNAKIALLDAALEVEKTEFSAEIRIRDPTQMKAFLDEETAMLRKMVDKVAETGANVVICQKGIDDVAQHFLAKKKILAVRRAKQSDMEKLTKATGARVGTSLEDLRPNDLGAAKLVEERKIGEDKMVFIEGCKDPKAVSILVRGGLERIVDEAERSMNDAIYSVADVIKENKIVAGGGAIEEELSKELRAYAAKVGGREQLAIEAFSQALESIPRTLAENAGLDPIDILVSLRASHEKPAGIWMGIDAISGKVIDMMKNDILDPQSVKEQAIRSAVEAASMILRIDDVIAASKPPEKAPPAGPPGPEMEY